MAINKLQEIRLFSNPTDREMYDNMGEVYAITMSIQALEKAFMKDCITQDQYTSRCTKLLAQYKTAWASMQTTHCEINTIEEFLIEYRLDAPLALQRIRDDKPYTIKDDKGNSGKLIAEISCTYITVSNYLEMEMTGAGDLVHDVSNLHHQLSRLSNLPNHSEAIELISKWKDVLKGMQASDALDEEQAKQMKLDVTTAHTSFDQFLENE